MPSIHSLCSLLWWLLCGKASACLSCPTRHVNGRPHDLGWSSAEISRTSHRAMNAWFAHCRLQSPSCGRTQLEIQWSWPRSSLCRCAPALLPKMVDGEARVSGHSRRSSHTKTSGLKSPAFCERGPMPSKDWTRVFRVIEVINSSSSHWQNWFIYMPSCKQPSAVQAWTGNLHSVACSSSNIQNLNSTQCCSWQKMMECQISSTSRTLHLNDLQVIQRPKKALNRAPQGRAFPIARLLSWEYTTWAYSNTVYPPKWSAILNIPMLHVWNIYQHLPYKWASHVGLNIPPCFASGIRHIPQEILRRAAATRPLPSANLEPSKRMPAGHLPGSMLRDDNKNLVKNGYDFKN